MSKLISTKFVRTRKSHNCFGCGRMFPAGTNMEYNTVVDDYIFNTYMCQSCQEVINNMSYNDEFCYGDLLDDVLELEALKEVNKNDT